MRWGAHIAIGIGLGAAIQPLAIPAVVLGATAPDWLEWLLTLSGRPVKHRTVTHTTIYWVLAAFLLLFTTKDGVLLHLFGFALGGLSHVLADACTVSGVPFFPWSTRRFHLFGGRLRTGQPAEVILSAAVLVCGVAIALLVHRGDGSGYLPFFPDYADKYERGIVDPSEWKQHRFTII